MREMSARGTFFQDRLFFLDDHFFALFSEVCARALHVEGQGGFQRRGEWARNLVETVEEPDFVGQADADQ